MAGKFTSTYDRSLTEVFGTFGLVRFARGIYVQSDDNVIWRGIWVTFNLRKGVLVTQPNVGVFCPAAEKLVSDGLKEIHSHETGRSYFGKLGDPVLTRPLYSLVRSYTGEERMPFFYDVTSIEQIDRVVKLMRDDYCRAGHRFLEPMDALPKLRDQLVVDDAAGSRMYAISVAYLINKHISPDAIDKLLGLQPNAISREFAEHFKRKFVGGITGT